MKDSSSHILKFYHHLWKIGTTSAEAMGWFNEETQKKRFDIFWEIADLRKASILDVGCGMGTFKAYLDQKGFDGSYSGIDMHENALLFAQKNFSGHWILGDFQNYTFSKKYDYVVASGMLAVKLEDMDSFIERTLSKLWSLSQYGIAVNFLSGWTEHALDSQDLFYCEPERAIYIAKKLSSRLILRHDYLPNDFTLYVYR